MIRSESWTWDVARDTLKSYLIIFNLGKGAKLRLREACNEPAGWPSSVSFQDFKGISYASKEILTKIIGSLIRHHMSVAPEAYFDPLVNREDSDLSDEENNQHDKVLDNQEAPQQVEDEAQPILHQGNQNVPLTLDPSSQWYWDYPMQLTLDPSNSFYWNYPKQIWLPYSQY